MPISDKTNRVLHFISLCLILILVRVWYLSVVQHEVHVEQAKKPQRRVTIEKADRATIYDRFGIPLAVNKIQYNASVRYADIRQIPTSQWKRDESGKRVRIAARSKYIGELALMLSQELGVDRTRVEDIIHGKAALLPHTPFVIKEDLSEEQYYRLRMLEKDWLGLQAERTCRRYYPQGKVGCDVLGYLGKIDAQQYLKIAHELRTLEKYIIDRSRNENPFLPEGFSSPEEVSARFTELQEKAYTMNDLIGKSGIEAFYEEALRGVCGKHLFEIDIKGNCLQELPGSRSAKAGDKLTLTISSELQDFAEKLLAASEGPEAEMRGGAVVAMIPKTGEIVALASYPRFDPNDFIPTRDPDLKKEKESRVRKWLENEGYISAIWEGRRPLEKEYFSFIQGKYVEEKIDLSWEKYLQIIISEKVKKVMDQVTDIKVALEIQEHGSRHPLLQSLIEDDQILAINLCHLIAPKERLSTDLLATLGSISLNHHYTHQQQAMRLLGQIQEEIQDLFHELDFATWREAHFKSYIKRKRKEEKEHKRYARPYIDYLDRIEQKLFTAFWNNYKPLFLYATLTGQIPVSADHLQPYFDYLKEFLRGKTLETTSLSKQIEGLAMPLAIGYLKTLRSFDELTKPEKHLASAFYPPYGYGFSRSQSFRQTSAQGSVFKIVTAYQVLLERYQKQKDFDFLTIIDDSRADSRPNPAKQVVGHFLDGTTLHRLYKGGILPRSSYGGMGKLDLIGAFEQSSNVYFALLAGDYLEQPHHLALAAKAFNFGEKTGVDLPNESKGNIPNDLDQNKTGLYSFAIGQHTLEVTPLQTAVMLSAIANQGTVVRPHLLKKSTETIRTIPFPPEVFNKITRGMWQVVNGPRGSGRPSIMRPFYDHPSCVHDYHEMHSYMIAKTGTAQVRYKQTVSREDSALMKGNIWFGAISYPSGKIFDDPELVVAVFLRFRQGGREGGPIAAQVIKKWRELQTKSLR